MTVLIPPEVDIIGGGGGSGSAGPLPPRIVFIAQANSQVVTGIVQSTVTGSWPIVQYKLYRSPTGTGGWEEVDETLISPITIITDAFDISPVFGVEEFYAATAIDSQGNESAYSNVVSFTASNISFNTNSPTNISSDAYGQWPVLGCDVFLNPITKEGVIGPNGDLMTVNGLELLAQDLRIRIFTLIGALVLHPTYGFGSGKVIGIGQASPQVQAQILRSEIIDCVSADPRVFQVLDVQINQAAYDSWGIAYDIMAIGFEDPQRLNMVYPFFLQ